MRDAKDRANFLKKSKQISAAMIVIMIVIAVAVIWLFIWLWKQLNPTSDVKARQQAQKQTEDVKTQAEKKGEYPTYPLASYVAKADIIYNSLKYSSFDDDADMAEQAIYDVVKKNLDWIYLSDAYGIRQRYNFGFNDGNPADLQTTLAIEFSSARKAKLNAYLKSKGVAVII